MGQTKSQDIYRDANKRQVPVTEAIMCGLGEYKTGQSKSVSSLLLELFVRGAAVAVPAGTCTAHTHRRKSSKRAATEQGLFLQRLPWQPAERASNRQNHLHYRLWHGQHFVQSLV